MKIFILVLLVSMLGSPFGFAAQGESGGGFSLELKESGLNLGANAETLDDYIESRLKQDFIDIFTELPDEQKNTILPTNISSSDFLQSIRNSLYQGVESSDVFVDRLGVNVAVHSDVKGVYFNIPHLQKRFRSFVVNTNSLLGMAFYMELLRLNVNREDAVASQELFYSAIN